MKSIVYQSLCKLIVVIHFGKNGIKQFVHLLGCHNIISNKKPDFSYLLLLIIFLLYFVAKVKVSFIKNVIYNYYMKILHIIGAPKNGGAEIFFTDAVKALEKAGVEQRVLHHKKNLFHASEMKKKSIPTIIASFNIKFKFFTKRKMKSEIDKFKPDIVHYWLARAPHFALMGNHINVGWYSSYKKVKHFKKCHYHLGVTEDVSRHIMSQGIPKNKVYTLPIYTNDADHIEPISRKSLNTPDNKTLLLSLARLHPVKGLDILLYAMQDLPNCYLWLAGDGPLEEELKSLCTDLKLNDRVHFLGWRNDKEALIKAADICVFPSRNDSFGAVMIEAWANKVPLIASKAPGPKVYIAHKEDGILTEIDNVQELVDAVREIEGSPSLRKKITENGYIKYKNNFSQESFIHKALGIYEDIIKKGK